ncbi:Higher eukaryotic phosphomevalonate kinase [Fusarium acutatum]|uniref:Higher eukaryotic phosphomevalonate kinase n=1 Tax=Fusarium acutatum TaxID=78861 RepID=A0A8H4NHI7_9HYPO|nr:Higher eukaryotic phosphomevalonate kinase [Fusarium acutatum]
MQADMATLDTLKQTLRQAARATASHATQPLSDVQYSAGFDVFMQGSESMIYQNFIVPQLSSLLDRLLNSRGHISVLEIGPGPKSVLGYLPYHIRRNVKRYVAFEPNDLFAIRLDDWFHPNSGTEPPLPRLERRPDIHHMPFTPDNDNKNTRSGNSFGTSDGGKFDVILFCHSMYGMKPKRRFIEQALKSLNEHPEPGIVVVFHRDGDLNLDGLVCHYTASFPTGVVRVATDDETLDRFTSFIAGFAFRDAKMDEAIRGKWRELCHALGRCEKAHPDHLLFSSPNIIATFTKHAIALPDLMAQMPLVNNGRRIKNQEARLHRPASIVRPTQIQHIQQCVKWALEQNVGLTVIGGSHSGQCLWPNVVAIDMSAFDQVHTVKAEREGGKPNFDSTSLVIAETGCNTGDIIRKTMAVGLTVPLGARPSVGSGLWLQGGIGHLARLHGLACDAIVGAVMVSVASGQLLSIGRVPSKYRPADAVQSEVESDMLWALKGAGTNFGIVVSVIFEAHAARTYSVRNWSIPLKGDHEARLKLHEFDQCTRTLSGHCSADAYLYLNNAQIHLGVTLIESATTKVPPQSHTLIGSALGPEDNLETVDGVGLFETEMYISGMHGGHGGGKTSSFKRCLFLKQIGAMDIANVLVAAIETRPSPLCYIHLLQGGGALRDVADDATAFGCRDWDFACVITAVWPRDQDGTEVALGAVQWVYNVTIDLLPLSSGAYGADLGPDPRDTALAAKAFGPNRPRLAWLKQSLDPRNVLAYACPLPKPPMKQKLIILVTGESGVGKDYCADVWVSMFTRCAHKHCTAHKASISDATKREYAAATGAGLDALLGDRAYKEQHRPALTAFFKEQMRQQPRLPVKHFLNVVSDAADMDVLVITGMRDEAPTATLSHLVPNSRLLDIRVTASEKTRQARRKCQVNDNARHDYHCKNDNCGSNGSNSKSNSTTLDYRHSLVFDNEATGDNVVRRFADKYLLPLLHKDLDRLANMVVPVPDFPRSGIEFRHVLNIAQQQGGLALCTSLLQTQFKGDWSKVGAVACCEAGGFVYASALAQQVDVPLALIREAGKLPPPTICVKKPSSHISGSGSNDLGEKRIEISQDLIPRGASVVVIDDVLATGKTLCAVLQLLAEAGISIENISIMVVAEFPVHHGRELLYHRGFGGISMESLLVFDGV